MRSFVVRARGLCLFVECLCFGVVFTCVCLVVCVMRPWLCFCVVLLFCFVFLCFVVFVLLRIDLCWRFAFRFAFFGGDFVCVGVCCRLRVVRFFVVVCSLFALCCGVSVVVFPLLFWCFCLVLCVFVFVVVDYFIVFAFPFVFGVFIRLGLFSSCCCMLWCCCCLFDFGGFPFFVGVVVCFVCVCDCFGLFDFLVYFVWVVFFLLQCFCRLCDVAFVSVVCARAFVFFVCVASLSQLFVVSTRLCFVCLFVCVVVGLLFV